MKKVHEQLQALSSKESKKKKKTILEELDSADALFLPASLAGGSASGATLPAARGATAGGRGLSEASKVPKKKARKKGVPNSNGATKNKSQWATPVKKQRSALAVPPAAKSASNKLVPLPDF